MNTRRGFFRSVTLAVAAAVAAPKNLIWRKRQPKFCYDPTKYIGEIEWLRLPVSPWLRLVQGGKFPSDLGLTERVIYRKV